MKKNVADYLEFNFEKIKILKQTGKGEVWLVQKKNTPDFFVMKLINFSCPAYKILQNISCSLCAKIFYCAITETDTVIVEEFIQGENFAGKNMSTANAKKFLLQMCDGLKILHENKIVHRDIKPENLILQGDKIRLIDFDAARIFKSDKNKDTKILGTEYYAPPEQFGFGQTDPRSDIFSLGKTFQELAEKNLRGDLKKILSKCTE